MITDIFKTYSNFLYQGGPVVLILFFISIYLFVLIFAKFKHLFFDMHSIQDEYKENLANIKNDDLYLLNITSLKSDYKSIVKKDFYIIQTLIALCPILGLLGTVTGMIEVFDIMAKIPRQSFPGGRFLRNPSMKIGMLYYSLLDRI